MKKKLLLGTIALLSTISLSGRSFLTDIISGSDSPSGSENGNNGGSKTPSSLDLDVWNFKPKKMVLKNKVTLYRIDDAFVFPDVFILDDDDNEYKVTKGITFSDKDREDPNYDETKYFDVDMSKTTGDDSITVYARYQCIYDKGNNTTAKYSFSHSYPIHINPRNDTHYDPISDTTIKTLEVKDVYTSFNQGDEFVKPKVFAVKFDNSKTEITDSCIFQGYDMNEYGYQNVEVVYNDHTISYEIVIHNQEEENVFPFMVSGINMRLSIQKKLFVSSQKGQLYFVSYEKDGSIINYGAGLGQTIENVTYASENSSIVSIDENGLFQAKAPGSVFLYATVRDAVSTAKYVYRAKIVVEEKVLTELKVNNYKYNYYSGHAVNFAGDIVAVYQNGYEELINPDIDLSEVDTDVPGQYNVVISYTVNGKTLSVTEEINILDSSLYVLNKTELKSGVTDYDRNLGFAGTPSSGTIKSLVVPVKFTDSDKYITNYNYVREDIGKCFFGTNEDVGWRSVKTYYEEESAGLISYSGSVSEVYEDTHPSTYYYKGDAPFTLKDDIIDWYFTNHTEEDIKDYDSDHDGFIDSVNIIYLVPDATTSGVGRDVAGNLWGMVKARNQHSPDVDHPACNRFMWVSYDFIYPTNEIALARTGKSNYSLPAYSSGNSNVGNEKLIARTFIHENAHMLGINDYYSYSEEVYFAGDLNMQTLNYMGHDPYSLMLYNWAKPYIPEITSTITIGDFQKTHDVILLTPSWNSIDSPFDEYFLLDLFVPDSGLNAFDATVKYPTNKAFNTIGVRLWHVDARLATIASSYEDFVFDPTIKGARHITDNSYGEYDDEYLEKYDRFMELQLVRNVEGYDYRTSSSVLPEHYFQTGDTFSMSDFASQFVNGTKMDNGKDLGWTVRIDGIYSSSEGYIADITVTKQ